MLNDESAPREASSHRIARNSVLHFASLGLPALTALFLVPVTVRALGPARFGLLALAWAVAEGSGMFDFGLGRATVRFVADATEKGLARLRQIVLASVFSQTAAGLLAGLILYALAPLLVERVFSISPEASGEAVSMFRVLALHMPVLLAAAALRSSLEGAQRFDISAALRIPGSIASVAIPAIIAYLGHSLVTIMWWLLAVRVVLVVISAIAVSRSLRLGAWRFPESWGILVEMLRYSGWVAVSTALGPLLGSFDRFVVGSVVGVAGLGYYTGAAESATRFLLIPVTAFSALLPALAATDARGARERSLAVTRSARRQLATVLFPLCLVLFAFAPGILGFWLGADFGESAGTALRILTVGVFFGGLAHLPMALLYGSNRPDLPAKIHVVQAILYVPVTFALVRAIGINGAALAWMTRNASDLLLYEIASHRSVGRAPKDETEGSRINWLSISSVALGIAFIASVSLWESSKALSLMTATVAIAGYTMVGWTQVFTPAERHAWTTILFRRRPVGRAVTADVKT
jgi:O-antigen/teichoic acid export membrane protein